ncbi:MAG TPA: hypothetical protein VK718_08070 [Ferruginibacter sp.]|jgi:hypothetical protein|nr:hypothetical protein [Ferruginibacter sp.]
MELQLKIIGCLLIVLSLLHIIFSKIFDWKNELNNLSLINKQMMHVHTFFIALAVFLMGLLCLSSTKELIETGLGKKITASLCVFWSVRLFIQFFWYSPKLWKGKKTETIIHIFLSCLWAYLSVMFFIVCWNNKTL